MNATRLRLTTALVQSWTSQNGYRYETGWGYTIDRKFDGESMWCGVHHRQGYPSERDARVAGKAAMKLYQETAE